MKKVWLSLLLLSVPTFAEPMKVEVIQLELSRYLSIESDSRATITPNTTRLDFLLLSPSRPILAINKSASKLEKFTDDKTNFNSAAELVGLKENFLSGGNTTLYSNGHYCQIRAYGPFPAKGAKKIVFAATLSLRRGVLRKTVLQKNILAKNGTKIYGGPVPMELAEVRKDHLGNLWIGVKFLKNTDRDVKFEFLDAAGKVIPHHFSGTVTSGTTNNITENFMLLRKTSVVNLRMSYWDKVETLTVPVRIKTGLDLQNSSNAQSKSR